MIQIQQSFFYTHKVISITKIIFLQWKAKKKHEEDKEKKDEKKSQIYFLMMRKYYEKWKILIKNDYKKMYKKTGHRVHMTNGKLSSEKVCDSYGSFYVFFYFRFVQNW